MSKLTKTANVLIVLLIIILVALILIYVLFVTNVLDEIWFVIAALLEAVIGIISYVYTSKYEINHSYAALNEHQEYCKELSDMLSEKHITNRLYLAEIIDRYKMAISNQSKKMEHNLDSINKLMQVLIIPVSIAILGGLFKKELDIQLTFATGISFLLGSLIFYMICFYTAAMYNNITLKKRQDNYKKIVNDLQSIIDFEKCNNAVETTSNAAV